MYLLTHIVRNCKPLVWIDIEELVIRGKENSELAGRSEVNLIDLLSALLDLNIKKDDIKGYLKESKIRLSFGKQSNSVIFKLVFIGKIFESERNERESLIKKINSNNVCDTSSISENILKYIPKPLKIFPRDFALKETEVNISWSRWKRKLTKKIKKGSPQRN